MIPRHSPADIDALKSRNPVPARAGEWVKLRERRHPTRAGFTHVGPCPICSRSQRKSDGRFECNDDRWVCGACGAGGDVIALVMRREGLDFAGALEWLGGVEPSKLTPESAKRAGRDAFKRGEDRDPSGHREICDDNLEVAWCAGWDAARKAESYAAYARERERKRLYAMWCRGLFWRGSPVEDYLRGRGVTLPDNARIRFLPDACLFADGRENEPVLLHRGWAMLAAILAPDDRHGARFAGLHFTWLDPAGPKGKLHIIDPSTGEPATAKKSRGSKQGGYIDLGGCPWRQATAMASGEGIESLASVYTALLRAGALPANLNFRCAIDLGNLAGKALETVAHPTDQDKAGRPRRVPGPDPDLSSPAMPLPDRVTEWLLIGDGDSEWFLTRNALLRARARHARDGRVIRIKTPAGCDANDLLLTGMPDVGA